MTPHTLTCIASVQSPTSAKFAPLRAAAHRVIDHDACPPLSAEALDRVASELDTTTVGAAWTRISEVLNDLNQDEVRRDLEHVAGLVHHSSELRKVKVHRGILGVRHEEQLELPGSQATADEDLAIKLIARWLVLDPRRDYYRLCVPETENTPKVVAVYDKTAADAWVLNNGEVVDIIELPDQRPAWRRWLDEAQPTES